MALPKSREWFDWLLVGNHPAEDDIIKIATECRKETHWIEFKAGARLGGSDPAAMLRRYVSGFANADGGAIIIGIKPATKASPPVIDGAIPPGGGSLNEWATRALAGLRGTLPDPRFYTTDTASGAVLTVAVGRARMPVPDVGRNRDLVFHVRIHDQTVEMPPWLATDLLLGRRAQPELAVMEGRLTSTGTPTDVGAGVSLSTFVLRTRVENLALIDARDVRLGLVTFTLTREPKMFRQHQFPARLLESVNTEEPIGYACTLALNPWRIIHASTGPDAAANYISPFTPAPINLDGWPVPSFPDNLAAAVSRPDPSHEFRDIVQQQRDHARGAIEVQAGLYVLARDCEPWWHQVTLRVHASMNSDAATLTRRLRIRPCLYERPKVSVRFLREDEPLDDPEQP